jgi:hypothetical protein
MRLGSDVIAWLKADGRGYQTKANWLLRHAMLHYTRESGLSKHEGVRRKRGNRKEARDDVEPEQSAATSLSFNLFAPVSLHCGR